METASTITIRRGTPGDLDAILPLVGGYRVFYEQPPDEARERAFIESHLRDHTSVVYLAHVDGKAAGFVQLFKTYSTVHLEPCWILEDLFVAEDYRHRGVAGALLARGLQHAMDDGAAGMFLETAHDNVAAQALYEKSGWKRETRFIKYNAPLP